MAEIIEIQPADLKNLTNDQIITFMKILAAEMERRRSEVIRNG